MHITLTTHPANYMTLIGLCEQLITATGFSGYIMCDAFLLGKMRYSYCIDCLATSSEELYGKA